MSGRVGKRERLSMIVGRQVYALCIDSKPKSPPVSDVSLLTTE